MRRWLRHHTLLLSILLSFLGGCVPAARGPTGPVVSPTGIVYAEGIPPVETRFSQTATLYLRGELPERALELLLEGVAAEPENPIHHFLAGTARIILGEYREAASHFDEAERLYPAYELETEPLRENAWAEAFNLGLAAYGEGDVEGTIEAWEGAAAIFALRTEADRNLGGLYLSEGRYEEASVAYFRALDALGRVPATRLLREEEKEERLGARGGIEDALGQLLLFTNRFEEAEPLLRSRLSRDPTDPLLQSDLAAALLAMDREEEAMAIYRTLLTNPEMESTLLFNLGVSLFRTGEYGQAAEAFAQLTRREPGSRDAWFNRANALLADQDWSSLAELSDALVAADPLSESVGLIVARSHLEMGDEPEARRALERVELLPVYLEGLRFRAVGNESSIFGTIIGNQASEGTPVTLRFHLRREDGGASERLLTLQAPPPGEVRPFEFTHPEAASSYGYELLIDPDQNGN